MSDDGPTIFVAPTGRRLEAPDAQPGLLGTLRAGGRPEATKPLLKALRRRIGEVDAADIERADDRWLDTRTGEAYSAIREFVDPLDPAEYGATAFTQLDDAVVFLRPVGDVQKTKSVELGTITSQSFEADSSGPRPGSVAHLKAPNDGLGWFGRKPKPPPAEAKG